MTEEVRIEGLRIQVTHPEAASGAGVLLYPTIMGIDGPMEDFASSLAATGVTAAVWDPYDGEGGTGEIKEMLLRSKQCEDQSMVRDLTRIVDHLRDELELREIAALGWCFGGRIALLHAGSDDRIDLVCAYNPTLYSPTPVEIAGIGLMSRADFPGQTMDEFALSSSIRGPVQVSRPERDFTQNAEYQRLFEVLCGRSGPTIYEFHPGASHGFSYTPGEANEKAHRVAWATTETLLAGMATSPLESGDKK